MSNPHVPEQYTVEFGEKVAKSFIWLGGHVDRTNFRLNHLEKHLGETVAELEKLQKVGAITAKEALRRSGGKKRLIVALGVGVYLGVKLAKRENQDKLKQAYSNGVDKAREAKEAGLDKTVDKIEEMVYGSPEETKPGPVEYAVKEPDLITPEHDVTR